MADNTVQFVNEVQGVTRSMYEAIQGFAGTQANFLQRLGEVQRDVLNQAFEATNDQLQLIGRLRDPREFASAQANLAKSHGQRHVDSVKKTVDIVVEGWQEYSDRLEKTANAATHKAQRAARSNKVA
jgi:hypothetical protein